MGRLFPGNGPYQFGQSAASWFLMVIALLTIIPGCIHTFLPDGGANLIAGLGMDPASEYGREIVSLFAWAGATQIVWGFFLMTIALRYRAFVPLALGLLTLERVIHALNMWGPKGGDHHPPEAYATLLLIPVLAIAFALSLRHPKGQAT
jgi:hypothetical protein